MAGDAFQKMKSSFNRGVTAISVKTASSLEKAKIKTHMESIQMEIGRLMASAGETGYGLWEAGDPDLGPVEAIFETIRQKKQEILQLQEQYQAIDVRDSQILGNVQEETPVEEPGGGICPNCGAEYMTPAKFCRKCGQKLV